MCDVYAGYLHASVCASSAGKDAFAHTKAVVIYMIYTLTLNPALDYVMHLREAPLRVGCIQRSQKESYFPSGKGINVSLVLHELGVPSVAMGFAAGFTGDALEAGLREAGVAHDFVRVAEGLTRINVKLRAAEETDINGCGPAVTSDECALLLEKLDALRDGDTLVLAGSIPATLPVDIYQRIMQRLMDGRRKIRFVVDAAGQLLLCALAYHPFLIKPNLQELEELFETEIQTQDHVWRYAACLQERGARNVLVSMGDKGALLLNQTGARHVVPAFQGHVVNTVGAGDAMIAGFLAGVAETEDFAYALRLGTACGSATAFSEGLASCCAIRALLS